MGQFLKQTLASLIGSLASLLIFFFLGTSSLVFLLALLASTSEGIKIEDKSFLIFDLSSEIGDTESMSGLGGVFSGEDNESITVRQLLSSLDKAAKDERIAGIFLDARGREGDYSYATLTEIRPALERFKAAGKKIVAYANDLSEKEYYLISLADSIVLNPMGTIQIDGLSSERLFWAGALEKYGVEVQVVRSGNYKSFAESFTRKNLSAENKEQLEALLKDVWKEFLDRAAASRNLTPQKLQAVADSKGFLTPEEAKAIGLIDRVAYFDEVIAELQKLTGNTQSDRSFAQVRLGSYRKVPRENARQNPSNNKIAVIYASGSIVDGEGSVGEIGGERYAKELRELKEDKSIKAVVFRINSPGGSATASEIIRREMELLARQKPVIVSMGEVAASGGYWISTAANQIFAQPNTISGSIGVLGLSANIQELANNNGITWDVVKTGELANIDSIARPKTARELAIRQQEVDRIYEMFLDRVAKSRNMPKEKVDRIARGRIWSGEAAIKIGLVDRLGGLEAAIEHAAQKANLGKDWEIKEYPESFSLEAEFLKKFLSSKVLTKPQPLDPLSAEFLKFKKDIEIWQSLNDPKGIYAILPFNLKIE